MIPRILDPWIPILKTMPYKKVISFIVLFCFTFTVIDPDYLFSLRPPSTQSSFEQTLLDRIKLEKYREPVIKYLGKGKGRITSDEASSELGKVKKEIFRLKLNQISEDRSYRIYFKKGSFQIEELEIVEPEKFYREKKTLIKKIIGFPELKGWKKSEDKRLLNYKNEADRPELTNWLELDIDSYVDKVKDKIDLKSVKKVLIIGTGPTLGEMFGIFKKYPELEKVYIVELLKENIVELCKTFSELSSSMAEKIEIYQADVRKLPFENSHFDLVYSSKLIREELLGKFLAKSWKEIKRVIKTDGLGIAIIGNGKVPGGFKIIRLVVWKDEETGQIMDTLILFQKKEKVQLIISRLMDNLSLFTYTINNFVRFTVNKRISRLMEQKVNLKSLNILSAIEFPNKVLKNVNRSI